MYKLTAIAGELHFSIAFHLAPLGFSWLTAGTHVHTINIGAPPC
jgi:hypothetical protein